MIHKSASYFCFQRGWWVLAIRLESVGRLCVTYDMRFGSTPPVAYCGRPAGP